jgi:hypothetical protein
MFLFASQADLSKGADDGDARFQPGWAVGVRAGAQQLENKNKQCRWLGRGTVWPIRSESLWQAIIF